MSHLDDRCLVETKTIIEHMICGYLYSQGLVLIHSNRSIIGWQARQAACQPASQSISIFNNSNGRAARPSRGRQAVGQQAWRQWRVFSTR